MQPTVDQPAEVQKGAARARAMLMLHSAVRAQTLASDLRTLSPAEAAGYARQLATALDLLGKLGVAFYIADAPAGDGHGIGARMTFKEPAQ